MSSDLVLGLYFIIVPGNLFQSQNAPKVNALYYEHVPEGPTWIQGRSQTGASRWHAEHPQIHLAKPVLKREFSTPC